MSRVKRLTNESEVKVINWLQDQQCQSAPEIIMGPKTQYLDAKEQSSMYLIDQERTQITYMKLDFLQIQASL